MYVIKMKPDKSLETTIHATIYQHEKNADTLVFLVPKTYENENIADCIMLLRYILPNGIGKSEQLDMEPEPYNKNYYRYHLKMDTAFTDIPGIMELWLSALNMNDQIILKSGSTEVEITAAKDIADYLCLDDLDQLDKMALQIEHIQKSKADSLVYHDESRTLQLTAEGTKIGLPVVVPADDYADEVEDSWTDMTDPEDSGSESWEPM